jgi:hypothetical protein
MGAVTAAVAKGRFFICSDHCPIKFQERETETETETETKKKFSFSLILLLANHFGILFNFKVYWS